MLARPFRWELRGPMQNGNRRPNYEWREPDGGTAFVPTFFSPVGVKPEAIINITQGRPHNFYELLVNDELFEFIAYETNLYASQLGKAFARGPELQPDPWSPTNKYEIKRLFGLMMWIGLENLPSADQYLSEDEIFYQIIPCSVMSKARFNILIQMLHFSDNLETGNNSKDRRMKLGDIIERLNDNFKINYDPEEIITVEEMTIPYHERDMEAGEGTSSMNDVFGFKMLRVSDMTGFTYHLETHTGKVAQEELPIGIVMRTVKPILNKGHTLYAGKSFASLDLAQKLLDGETHLVGSVFNNSADLPKDVTEQELSRGEMAAKQTDNGITVLKWKDDKETTMISTKHTNDFKQFRNIDNVLIQRPAMVDDYKLNTVPIDELRQYHCPPWKTMKWYQKVATEVLVNTSTANAYIMHQQVMRDNMREADFVKHIAMHLMNTPDVPMTLAMQMVTHEFQRKRGSTRTVRRMCVRCYRNNIRFGREYARTRTIRVVTYCADCRGRPHMCLRCFKIRHRAPQ